MKIGNKTRKQQSDLHLVNFTNIDVVLYQELFVTYRNNIAIHSGLKQKIFSISHQSLANVKIAFISYLATLFTTCNFEKALDELFVFFGKCQAHSKKRLVARMQRRFSIFSIFTWWNTCSFQEKQNMKVVVSQNVLSEPRRKYS